ncbi:MAG: organic hydroperoxide resistance protein [Hydrogenophilaceae bacterium]|jgi:Ohr subfamily peroxiredoxin|nr:organic hydroperoxide resistance protein [Hydrogenophilaceae bacterium]
MPGPASVAYSTSAHATGGRDGKVHLDNSPVWFAMAIPKDMGGSGLGSNPEQFFAMGYASCFNSAILFVAGQKKLDASKAKVTCEIGIGRNDAGGFALQAKLTVSIPGLDAAQARDLVEAAHQVCPYSNATRGQMPVELVVA